MDVPGPEPTSRITVAEEKGDAASRAERRRWQGSDMGPELGIAAYSFECASQASDVMLEKAILGWVIW